MLNWIFLYSTVSPRQSIYPSAVVLKWTFISYVRKSSIHCIGPWLPRIMNWFIMRWIYVKYPTNSLLAGSSKASNSSSCCITRNRLILIIADKMGEYSSGSRQPSSLTSRTASAHMSTLSYSFRVMHCRRSARQKRRHVRQRLVYPVLAAVSSPISILSIVAILGLVFVAARRPLSHHLLGLVDQCLPRSCLASRQLVRRTHPVVRSLSPCDEYQYLLLRPAIFHQRLRRHVRLQELVSGPGFLSTDGLEPYKDTHSISSLMVYRITALTGPSSLSGLITHRTNGAWSSPARYGSHPVRSSHGLISSGRSSRIIRS
jgi:hypothetical protein